VTTGDKQKKRKNPWKKLEEKGEFPSPKVCRYWWTWIAILDALSDISVTIRR
jgi:hypothetical protein